MSKLQEIDSKIDELASKAAAELAGAHEQIGDSADQRRFKRSDYSASGMIAWCAEEGIPAVREFRRVQYQDISGGGVGFRWPMQPKQKKLALVLRKADSIIVLMAKVVSARHDKKAGNWIIGCQFTRRIRLLNSE